MTIIDSSTETKACKLAYYLNVMHTRLENYTYISCLISNLVEDKIYTTFQKNGLHNTVCIHIILDEYVPLTECQFLLIQ